ncbi:MAG TPA: hypothetical protein VD793_07140 [Gemmatimonadales bacterium]|nr:hypothetical protein [Gemmatimonadales bacterium]
MAPVSRATITEWTAPLIPHGSRQYDLRWRFYTPRGSTGGRAAIRVAPPDSLRFDYRGPFGRSGAAVIVGDSVLWAEPEKDVRELIPLAPLFWAALGMPLPASTGAALTGIEGTDRVVWRQVVNVDTLDLVYVRRPETRLRSQFRQGGVRAATDVRLSSGLAVAGEMQFPRDGAAFVFTVEQADSTAVFDATTWRRP